MHQLHAAGESEPHLFLMLANDEAVNLYLIRTHRRSVARHAEVDGPAGGAGIFGNAVPGRVSTEPPALNGRKVESDPES